jgi:hypothetical protein
MTSGILLVDCREAVLKESGDVILSNAPIYGEAGEIFAGTRAKPPSGSTTVFKSVGIAVEDICSCKAGVRGNGIGRRFLSITRTRIAIRSPADALVRAASDRGRRIATARMAAVGHRAAAVPLRKGRRASH